MPIYKQFITLNPYPDGCRDFSFSIDTGNNRWHVYFPNRPNREGWNSSVTSDGATKMEHWICDDPFTGWSFNRYVILTGTGNWIADKHFAPYVLKHNDTWWMFPTGLSAVTFPTGGGQANRVESIGVFSSTSLDGTWLPATNNDNGFLFNGSSCPWGTWVASSSTNYAGECRDVHIIQDTLGDNYWYAFVTVSSGLTETPQIGDGRKLALGIASSTTINGAYTWLPNAVKMDDGIEFRSSFVESPSIIKYQPNVGSDLNAYYIMSLYSAGQTELGFFTSATLTGDWTFMGKFRSSLSPDVSPDFQINFSVSNSNAPELFVYNRQIQEIIVPYVYDSPTEEQIRIAKLDPKNFVLSEYLRSSED